MGVIINPRGVSGAGKTELVRRILSDYGWQRGRPLQPLDGAHRDRPLAYRLEHPSGGRPLAVFGRYDRTCGGCDTIRLVDGGLDEVFRRAAAWACSGYDVLMEGLQLSADGRGSTRLARIEGLHVLHLSTPLDQCIRNAILRRRARRDLWPGIAARTGLQARAIAEACDQLRQAGAKVEVLGFNDALLRARGLLGLPPFRRFSVGPR